MWQNFIQIAGVKSLEEANLLIQLGVEYIGFPLRLPVNKEDTTEEEAKNIISKIKKKSKPILITYVNQANEVIDFCKYLDVQIVQLHGKVELEEIKKIKNESDLKIIKSLIVRNNNLLELEDEINKYSEFVDAFITDTFNPKTGATGATGITHDWNISKKIVAISTKPIILAGGLNPENVEEAIHFVKPAGVDSHTGVENSNGDKTEDLIRKFMLGCRKGFVIPD